MPGAVRYCDTFTRKLGVHCDEAWPIQLRAEDVIYATKKAATHLLEFRGFLDDELAEIWAARGHDYFLRERPEDIAWHTEAIADF